MNKKQDFHPSQQNMQRALNTTRVFALLVHQFQKSINKFNMKTSFFVSPSIWEKWLIGRKAKESGIEILKKMGVLISYRYNRKKKMSIEEPRFVIMYQFNLQKVKWLYDCVRMVAIRDEAKQVDRYEEKTNDYSYDDIMDDLEISGERGEDENLL